MRSSGSSGSDRRLGALVFLAGFGSLGTEIVASRLIAPTFGASTVVWANVIGVVLASLALGYWLGGRVADRHPSAELLGWIVVAAAGLVAAAPYLSQPFLDLVADGLDEASVGVAVGSFLAVILVFSPAVVLLGMVAPFAIRLAVVDVTTAGATAGRLYALSTIGSLLGTFLPALLLIPLLGTQRTLLAIAAVLALAGSLLTGPRGLLVTGAALALAFVPPGSTASNVLDQRESRYQSIRVVLRPDGSRVLELNEGIAVHSVWRRDTVLTGGEWDAPLAVPSLLGRGLGRVAILGNAGGTTARALGRFYPRADVVGVELDPEVTAVGRRWLGLDDNPRLTVVTADARPFLRRTGDRYDLIVVDAYRQPYVPFYLATREFFRLVAARLRPGGIVLLNVARVPGDDRLVDGVAGTLATELPQVLRWPALRFNAFVVGLESRLSSETIHARLATGPAQLASLRELLARDQAPVAPASDPWTDDRAPVEWATDRMILGYAGAGNRMQFDYLPTRP